MAKLVYLLCAATSLLCAGLLTRAYWRKGTKLLLWSSVGFGGLAAGNILVYLDLVIYLHVDLLPWRNLATLAGVVSLLLGLLWDSL